MIITKKVVIQNFIINEFPENEVEYADIRILQSIDQLRNILGQSIIPSKAAGALARTTDDAKKSQHYSDKVNVFSKAIDWFPAKNANIYGTISKIMGSHLFGGVGVYFDTHGYSYSHDVMIHTDIRNLDKYAFTLLWFRQGGVYFYPQLVADHSKKFLQLLGGI